MKYEEIELQTIKVDTYLFNVLQDFKELYGITHKKLLKQQDYKRWTLVFSRINYFSSLLDIGVGAGQFLNALSLSGKFSTLTGLDVEKHSKFKNLSGGFDMVYGSVENLEFKSRQFDAITCMECLEHLEMTTFLKGLAELRRVCNKQLIITVPFAEKLPLPKYHKLRFDVPELEKYFPDGKKIIIKYQGEPIWCLIEEQY